MLDLLKKTRALFKPKVYILGWYPSDRSCGQIHSKPGKPKKVPPLMVRKAEWRR